jgi:hypothetical protein
MARLSDEEFLKRLSGQPALRERFESILSVSVNGEEGLEHADAAEARLVEEVRQLGRESLTAWAQRRTEESTAAATKSPGVWREGKKN